MQNKRRNISNPADLSVKETQGALRYCRTRASDLGKQAKSLKKIHLRNCLILAQEKEDEERAGAIKQKLNREKSVKMWTNIKNVVRDPPSAQVLNVQRVEQGVVCEYTTKEEVHRKSGSGGECETRFTLAHNKHSKLGTNTS